MLCDIFSDKQYIAHINRTVYRDIRRVKAKLNRLLCNMLTDKQQQCFDMRYNQDLSLGEIAETMGVSRQAVCDNLARTEALLRKMEQNIGCIKRSLKTRKTVQELLSVAEQLNDSALAEKIVSACNDLKE